MRLTVTYTITVTVSVIGIVTMHRASPTRHARQYTRKTSSMKRIRNESKQKEWLCLSREQCRVGEQCLPLLQTTTDLAWLGDWVLSLHRLVSIDRARVWPGRFCEKHSKTKNKRQRLLLLVYRHTHRETSWQHIFVALIATYCILVYLLLFFFIFHKVGLKSRL